MQAQQIVALCDLSSSEHHKTYLFLHTSVSINFSIRGAGLGGVALGTEIGREEYSFHLSSVFKLILLNIYAPRYPRKGLIYKEQDFHLLKNWFHSLNFCQNSKSYIKHTCHTMDTI